MLGALHGIVYPAGTLVDAGAAGSRNLVAKIRECVSHPVTSWFCS